MATVRSRAAERVNRISVNLDKSSGYLLGNNLNATPSSASLRRNRDGSIGTLGRNNLNLDLGTTVRFRDSSLNRGGRINPSDTAIRNSVMVPTSMKIESALETAKYSREQQMKEIHNNFMKQYTDTRKKLNDEPEDAERKSKAYQRIVNNDPPRYLDEREAQRACVSEMFMDTSKFSTKTLSAINGLDGAVLRKKDKEYNWRKEMDDYEKRAEYERDVRARNVSALHRNADPEEDHWVTQRNQVDRKRQTKEVIEKPIEKAAKKEVAVKTDSEPVKSWRERREAERKTEIIAEPEPERKSWREKLAEKQAKEEEEKKQKEADVAAAQAAVAEAKQRAEAAAADASADNKTTNAAESTADGEKAEGEEEEEDANGTKQLKSDIGFMFSGLEQEMEAGKSKLAKLRERIKKAKTAVKEADECTTEEEKESEAEKDKRRAELREKFRLQREAKKKAKAEQQ